MQKQILASLGLATMICLVGCDSGIPTYSVTGTVTDKSGSPIEGAAVSFIASGEGTANAVGVTDSAGKYTLKTKAKDGAQAGSYKVTIAKYASAEGDVATETPDLEDVLDITDEYPEDFDESSQGEGADDTGSQLAKKYASEKTSGLTAEVTSGSNTIDFQLEE